MNNACLSPPLSEMWSDGNLPPVCPRDALYIYIFYTCWQNKLETLLVNCQSPLTWRRPVDFHRAGHVIQSQWFRLYPPTGLSQFAHCATMCKLQSRTTSSAISLCDIASIRLAKRSDQVPPRSSWLRSLTFILLLPAPWHWSLPSLWLQNSGSATVWSGTTWHCTVSARHFIRHTFLSFPREATFAAKCCLLIFH